MSKPKMIILFTIFIIAVVMLVISTSLQAPSASVIKILSNVVMGIVIGYIIQCWNWRQ